MSDHKQREETLVRAPQYCRQAVTLLSHILDSGRRIDVKLAFALSQQKLDRGKVSLVNSTVLDEFSSGKTVNCRSVEPIFYKTYLANSSKCDLVACEAVSM